MASPGLAGTALFRLAGTALFRAPEHAVSSQPCRKRPTCPAVRLPFGHLLPEEDPDGLLAALDPFLQAG